MSKKVLIVHDDEAFVGQLSAAIAAAAPDSQVSSALSAPRALGLVAQETPDVIVIEAELVGVDGYAFTQQLKADPKTKDVPVVIVTAMPNESSALRARQVGASAHLSAAGAPDGIAGKVLTLAGAAPAAAPASGAPPVAPLPVAPASFGEQPAAPQQAAAAMPSPIPVVPVAPAPVSVPPVIGGGAEAVNEPMSVPVSIPVIDLPDLPELPGTVPVEAPLPVEAQPQAPVSAPETAPAPSSPGDAVPNEGYGAPQAVTPPAMSGAGPIGTGVPQPVGGTGAPQPVSGSVSAASQVSAPGSDIPHIDDLLRLMLERGGSDLHITVGSPPGIRQRGLLMPVEDMKPLTPRDTMEMIFSLLSEEQRRRFETELELDFAYSIPGVSRFRANVFQQRNSTGAVFRVIPIKIPTMDELALPKVCRFLADRPRGLVLVTGPTGSGKSTTLAAMINHINENKSLHIITLEDPIEFMHRNKASFVNQREVGEDTHSFAAALKRVLRQDPDVILVGEMRDLETISAAITAAETGHLVLATLHTTGGPETVDRIIDVFPPHQQQQVRMQLSNTLEGVLSQVLLRSTDGRSRMLAMEIMLGIPAISNLIREGKTHQMETIIQGGAQLGMQTLDQHLKILLTQGKISFEEAISKAKSPRELADMVGRKVQPNRPFQPVPRRAGGDQEAPMELARVRWTTKRQFVGTDEAGHSVVMDAKTQYKGEGSGIRPVELVLHGLAGCTGMDVISILEKKRQDVRGLEIERDGAPRTEDYPKIYTDIAVEYVVTGYGVNPDAVARAIELSEEKYCSVKGMLGPQVSVTTSYRVVDARDAGVPLLSGDSTDA